MNKRITLTLCMLVVTIVVSGCNIFPRSNESIRDEILEHLNQKYDREFTAIAMDRGSSSVAFTCFPTDGDPVADLVRVSRRESKDEGVYISDTFFGVLIREEVESRVTSLLSGIDIPFRVIFHSTITYYNNIFDSTKNLDDYISWRSDVDNLWGFDDLGIYLSLDNLDYAETFANQIFDSLTGTSFFGLTHTVFLPEEGFAKLTRTNQSEIIREYRERTTTISKNVK